MREGIAWAGPAATVVGFTFLAAAVVGFFFTFEPDDQYVMDLGWVPLLELLAVGVALLAVGRAVALLERRA